MTEESEGEQREFPQNDRKLMENEGLPLRERLAAFRRLRPVPPATGLIAAKGECDFALTDIERA